MSTAPENRQLAVAHNPVTAACDRSDVRELKHIFSAVAQIDALSGAFLAAFDRVLAAGYVKKIGDAAEALAVLKATVATLQLRDKERRAPVASKAATTLEALQAHAQTKSSPAVLEAINDLQVFVATLKSDAPASWTFVKSLAAVVTKEEVAPTSKVRSAVVDLLSTVNDAFGNALFATSETVAMAVHASAKSVPKNCVKYFVRHQLNLGGAVQGVWALVRDIGPSALLAYMVLKNEQLLPW